LKYVNLLRVSEWKMNALAPMAPMYPCVSVEVAQPVLRQWLHFLYFDWFNESKYKICSHCRKTGCATSTEALFHIIQLLIRNNTKSNQGCGAGTGSPGVGHFRWSRSRSCFKNLAGCRTWWLILHSYVQPAAQSRVLCGPV